MTSWQRRSISALSRCTRGEIEVCPLGRCAIGRRRAAAQADEHRRAAQTTSVAGMDVRPSSMCVRADVAQTAGEHDGLVVAAHFGPSAPGTWGSKVRK